MAKKTKMAERSNASYFRKLISKQNARARGAVVDELDKMMTFVLAELNKNVGSILRHYNKVDTLKPRLFNAALNLMLHGELKTSATAAGTEALIKFVEAKKSKEALKKEKKATAAVEA